MVTGLPLDLGGVEKEKVGVRSPVKGTAMTSAFLTYALGDKM